jgi:hypothetical protein
VRDLDRNHGNARLVILRRDRRRDVREGLELNHQIELVADEMVRVPERNRPAEAVVEDHQIQARGLRGMKEALREGARERELGALGCKSHFVAVLTGERSCQPIAARAWTLDEPLRAERLEQAKRRRHGEIDSGADVGQLQHRAGTAEDREDVARPRHHANEWTATWRLTRGGAGGHQRFHLVRGDSTRSRVRRKGRRRLWERL